MSRVAIVTDTDSSIPVELARQFGIRQVPINIHFGSDTYPAVEGLSDRQLFERVDLEGRLPTTFCEHFDCAQEYITAELTPGLSVHSGSGIVGVTFVMGD